MSRLIVKDRATKLYQFSLPSPITSLHIGRKSVQLLATSSQDAKIRLWRLLHSKDALLELDVMASLEKLGAPSTSSSGSLASLTAPRILTMTFDTSEELLLCGLDNGSILLYDLTKKKLLRLFSRGHSASVTCLDFHPFGDYFASGASDHTVKVWDMKRKNCLQTYKGHLSAITSLRFTPDGRWLVSGDAKGDVKLWDLTAGKILTQFCKHKGAVTCLDFHPTEFLLATGSEDGSVQYWDLDRFQLASGTQSNFQEPISCVSFTPDGKFLLAVSQKHLRVWSWEPDILHDSVALDWEGISDFAINQGFKNGFGVAMRGNELATWCIILDKLAPYKEGYMAPDPEVKSQEEDAPADNAPTKPRTSRRHRGAETKTSHDAESESSDSDSALVPKNTTQDTQKLLNQLRSSQFNMRSELRRAKRRQELEERFRKRRMEGDTGDDQQVESSADSTQPADSPSKSVEKSAGVPPRITPTKTSSPSDISQHTKEPTTKSSADAPLKKPFAKRKAAPLQTDNAGNLNYVVGAGAPPLKSRERSLSDPNIAVHNPPSADLNLNDLDDADFNIQVYNNAHRKSQDKAAARSHHRSAARAPARPTTAADLENQILDGSKIMRHIISARLTSLNLIARLWHEDFKLEAINHLCSVDDPALTVDVMSQLNQEPHANYFTLQMCKKLLALQVPLMDSKYEPFLRSAIQTTEQLHKRFYGIIKQSLHAPRLGRGAANAPPVDSRFHRCAKCRQMFLTIRGQLERLRVRHDALGEMAEQLHIQLSHYRRL